MATVFPPKDVNGKCGTSSDMVTRDDKRGCFPEGRCVPGHAPVLTCQTDMAGPVPQESVTKEWSTLKSRDRLAPSDEASIRAAQKIISDSDVFSRKAIEFVKAFFQNHGNFGPESIYHTRRLGGARVFAEKGDDKTVFVVACDKDEEDYQRVSRRLHEMRDIANAGSPCQAHTVVVDTFGCTFFISQISKEKLYSASMAPVEPERKVSEDLIQSFSKFLLEKRSDVFAQLITGSMKLLGIPLKNLKRVAAEVKRQSPRSSFVPILEDEVFLSATSDILSRSLRFVALENESVKRDVIARFLSALAFKGSELHDKLWKEIAKNSCEGCCFETMFSNPKRSIDLTEALMAKQKICFRNNAISERICLGQCFQPSDIVDFRFNVQELALVARARGLIQAYRAFQAYSSAEAMAAPCAEAIRLQQRAVGAFFQAFETYASNNSHYLECENALKLLKDYSRDPFDKERFLEFNSLRCFSKC